ncbi:uncharacterized protein LOC141729597 isoform X1 [Zonotrichia albicollis]|uniref:uncharacterized protein LOC141729597 isoform X1 n=1 Tax=Zonotrichia albicollis TaxID=44394 RepID=UPI003D810BC5
MFPVLGQSPTTRHFWPCSRTSKPPRGCLGVSAYQDCCAEIPQLPSVTALKLAESLLPHFENDNSHVQLLSIQLFYKVMELVVEEGEELLTTFVNQSLLPLFLRWHDENLYVAKASFQALLFAARFLRRMDLEELLTKARRIKFAESLDMSPHDTSIPCWRSPQLLQDKSRAAESPTRTLREAALRFMALQALKEDESPSCLSKLLQMIFEGRSAGLCLMDQMYQRPSAISSAH